MFEILIYFYSTTDLFMTYIIYSIYIYTFTLYSVFLPTFICSHFIYNCIGKQIVNSHKKLFILHNIAVIMTTHHVRVSKRVYRLYRYQLLKYCIKKMYRFATINKAHTTNNRNELYYKFNDNNNLYCILIY